jgi:hypothetical protein
MMTMTTTSVSAKCDDQYHRALRGEQQPYFFRTPIIRCIKGVTLKAFAFRFAGPHYATIAHIVSTTRDNINTVGIGIPLRSGCNWASASSALNIFWLPSRVLLFGLCGLACERVLALKFGASTRSERVGVLTTALQTCTVSKG